MTERKPCRAVAGRGHMFQDGYVPENVAWIDELCDIDPSTTTIRRWIGRDPMTIQTATLTAAGHPPRNTAAIVSALGDVPRVAGMVRHKHLRNQCLSCAENAAEVRRCAIINCPIWAYCMGRNPHNPRRGIDPPALAKAREKPVVREVITDAMASPGMVMPDDVPGDNSHSGGGE